MLALMAVLSILTVSLPKAVLAAGTAGGSSHGSGHGTGNANPPATADPMPAPEPAGPASDPDPAEPVYDPNVVDPFADPDFADLVSAPAPDSAGTIPPDLDLFQTIAPEPAPDTSHSSGSHGSQQPNQNGQPLNLFTDLTNHWAQADIEALYAQGVIGGDGSGRFYPERLTTQAEFLKMLVTVAKVPAGSAATSQRTGVDMSALDRQAWYYPYVVSAVSAGIVTAADGKLDPNGQITREQVAAMAVRAAGKGSLAAGAIDAITGYADSAQISPWARGYVGLAKELRLMQGVGSIFVPQAPISRAEAAALVMRLTRLDMTPPTVRATARGNTAIALEFSEPVDRRTAETLTNYELNGVKITGAKLQENGKTVLLTTAALTGGRTYHVKLQNVRDLAWNTTAPVALPVVLAVLPAPEKVLYQDPRHVDIAFSKELVTDATVQVKVVNRATGKPFGSPYALEAEGKVLHLMLSAEMTPGASYSIGLAGVRDKAGVEMAPAVLELAVSKELLPPTVTKVTVTGPNTFQVEFSEPLGNPGTYSATGFVSAVPRFVGTSKTLVQVTVTTTEPDGGFGDRVPYAVLIRDVVDASGIRMHEKTEQISYAKERVAPTIQTVKAVGPTAVEILFSEPVAEDTAKLVSNYSLVRENTAALFLWSTTREPILSTDRKTLHLYLEEGSQFTNGARYTLSASGVKDLAGNQLALVHRTFTVTAGQALATLPVTIDRDLTHVTGGNTIEVVFTAAVDVTTARTAANYSITLANDLTARVSVSAATIVGDRTVRLTTGLINSDVRLTVRNVKDKAAKSMIATAINLPPESVDWSAVTGVRLFHQGVELTRIGSLGPTPEVKLWRTGQPEPSEANARVDVVDGRTFVDYDFAALGTNGFGRSHTLKVFGAGTLPSTWTFTPTRDATAPTVTAVTVTDIDRVTVRFSEEVTVLPGSVRLDATELTALTSGPSSTWVFVIPVDVVTGKAQSFTIADGGAEDRNGVELASTFTKSVTVKADVTRPAVKSVTVLTADTVEVTFTEPVTVGDDSFKVVRKGTALTVDVLSVSQPGPAEALLTLDLAPATAQEEYVVSIVGSVWDQAATPNEISSGTTGTSFKTIKLATRVRGVIALAQEASSASTEILVTDNAAGQQDRIQGEAGAVEANAHVLVYVDGVLQAIAHATANGSFGAVAFGDYDAPREVRVIAVDADGNTGETSTIVNFTR